MPNCVYIIGPTCNCTTVSYMAWSNDNMIKSRIKLLQINKPILPLRYSCILIPWPIFDYQEAEY